jgi:hypothetical protein
MAAIFFANNQTHGVNLKVAYLVPLFSAAAAFSGAGGRAGLIQHE